MLARCIASLVALVPLSVHATEASTRAAGTALARIPLVNAGFESTRPGTLGAPEGWWTVQHAGPPSYTFTLDTATRKSGERSLRVENIGPEPYGTIFQVVAAQDWRGKTLRFSAWLRTDGAKGNRFGTGAGLTLFALRGGSPAAHRQMRTDAIAGTTDWKHYEITLDVPIDVDRLEVGLTLYGPGIAWLDDTTLEVIGSALKPESGGESPAGRAQ